MRKNTYTPPQVKKTGEWQKLTLRLQRDQKLYDLMVARGANRPDQPEDVKCYFRCFKEWLENRGRALQCTTVEGQYIWNKYARENRLVMRAAFKRARPALRTERLLRDAKLEALTRRYGKPHYRRNPDPQGSAEPQPLLGKGAA